MPWNRRRLPVLASLLLLVSGCASTRPGPAVPSVTDPERLWKRYEQAVETAMFPRPDHISRELVPILTYTPGLVWDEGGQKVLMVAWSKAEYYTQQPPYETTIPVDEWLTVVPFVQRFCRKTGLQGDALRLRLAQRLGLPPDASDNVFVQMWVDPHTFFRPCPDPEITDRECGVNLTAGPVDPSAPCPWSAALKGQLSARFVAVSQSQLDWMCTNWTSRYPAGEPRKSYPWTALGYTYDWGAKDFRGESEFVLPANTPVVIESITPTGVYCAASGPRAGR